jgi:hypothetical protein
MQSSSFLTLARFSPRLIRPLADAREKGEGPVPAQRRIFKGGSEDADFEK